MNEEGSRKDVWKRARTFVGLVAMAFVVTLALIVGNRLSDEALGVLAGAVCGVGAAIPTSLLVIAVSRRRDEPQVESRPMHQAAYPPVVVVAPPGSQGRSDGWNSFPPSLTAPTQRNFTVVGGTPVDMEARSYERYS